MPGMTEQLTGSVLGGYRIERLLGRSQLGAAYLALQPERGIRAMVTTFHFSESQAGAEREQFRARFAREGAALTRLVHANILPIYAFGEQPDYIYLVTAFAKEASLGQILKQSTRFAPQQTLHILKQLAAGLDYAHSQGIMHGMLSLANVVAGSDLQVGIAGFGLRTMLEIHGNEQSSRPLAHLSSVHGAFLGNPEYVSPERVLGLPIDARADIYALGVILFALLSGKQPFHGNTPLDLALQRLQQPPPLVHAACAEVPEAFDLVIGRMLERDPTRRFQSAGEVVTAFERVVKAQEVARDVSAQPATPRAAPDEQLTLPPTVNWFDEQVTPSGRWQVAPPIGAVTEPLEAEEASPGSAISPALQYAQAGRGNGENLLAPPTPAHNGPGNFATGTETVPLPVPAALPATSGKFAAPASGNAASLAGVDPFVWWSSAGNGRRTPQAAPARHVPLRLAMGGARPDQRGRRKVVTMLATGVVAAGALTVGGITFARLTQSMKQPQRSAHAPAAGSSSATGGMPQTPANSSATATPQSAHTGTVIGSTMLTVNNSLTFSNPADGIGSLLIHLADGKFVACERTCPHRGVAVNYDPQSRMLVCPAHGAVFDPLHGFKHIAGPGNGPLVRVAIHVNSDGTITTPA